MVERYRRGGSKPKLLGNHQKCGIWGRHAVLETLRAKTWAIVELLISDELSAPERAEVDRLAADARVRVQVVEHNALRKQCHSSEHQGMIAKMTEFPYVAAGDLLEAEFESPLFLVLDSIQDPYNFGAMIRTCDGLGVDAVIMADRGQVGVTSLVTRTSAGAVNYVPIVRVPDVAEVLTELSARGVSSYATDAEADTMCFDADFGAPTAIVIGNEGVGLTESVRAACTQSVAVPQVGHVDSLNAAISASVLLYEAARQRMTTY